MPKIKVLLHHTLMMIIKVYSWYLFYFIILIIIRYFIQQHVLSCSFWSADTIPNMPFKIILNNSFLPYLFDHFTLCWNFTFNYLIFDQINLPFRCFIYIFLCPLLILIIIHTIDGLNFHLIVLQCPKHNSGMSACWS